MAGPAKISVLQSVHKGTDLECHLRIVEVEGIRVVEFRDYIPSLGEYGRGYWVPGSADEIFSLINGLTEAARALED